MRASSTYITSFENAFTTGIYSKHGEDILLHLSFAYQRDKFNSVRNCARDYYGRKNSGLSLLNSMYTAWVCQKEGWLHSGNGLFSFSPKSLMANSFKFGWMKERYGESECLNGKTLAVIGASDGRTLAYFIKSLVKNAKESEARIKAANEKAAADGRECRKLEHPGMIEVPDYGMIFTLAMKDMPYRMEPDLKFIEKNGMPDPDTLRNDFDWNQCILPARCSIHSERVVDKDTPTVFSFKDAPVKKLISFEEASLAADVLLKKSMKQLISRYGEALVKSFIGEPVNYFEEQAKASSQALLHDLRAKLNDAVADAKMACEKDLRAFNQARTFQRDEEIAELHAKFKADVDKIMKTMNLS